MARMLPTETEESKQRGRLNANALAGFLGACVGIVGDGCSCSQWSTKGSTEGDMESVSKANNRQRLRQSPGSDH
ncbi:hypothetical protein N7535_002052 [Penicillium sp. DV-2018c]|nr:hypothetical protein N7461_004704 [Penicillium sp. DV-2018c]KAJ5583432.1 hypothetical protein N7535_002052 [Penicillium sp. DV-2018c]